MKKNIILIFILIFIIVIASVINSFNIDLNFEISNNVQTNLPKIYLSGDIGSFTPEQEEIVVPIQYESDNINFEGFAKMKLQGSSSRAYDKKNYNIKLYEDESLDNKLKIDLGWGKENKYCLKANWIDKTHSRNIVTANIVADVQKKYNLFTDSPNYGAIDGFPVELYLNDEFWGLYTLNIPKKDWMFAMDESNPNHLVFSANSWSVATQFRTSGDINDWEVEVGLRDEESLEKLMHVIEFVDNSTDEEFRNNLEDYFNLDSLLNYYVMMQFGNLTDNGGKNALLVTYDGKLWYASLYDLDTSWGVNWTGSELLDPNLMINLEKNQLWSKLIRCFPNELADRYFELRNDIFTKDYVMNKFYTFINSIPNEVYQKEKQKWLNIPGFDTEQISDFLDKRISVVDEYFNNMYTEKNIVSAVYEKNIDNSITVKLVSNNKNFIYIGDCSYTYKDTGTYTLYYSDYLGNINSIETMVSNIDYKRKKMLSY